MKLPDLKDISDYKNNRLVGVFNVFSLLAVSLTWGHMLGLISPWFIPLTVLCVITGYGSELNKEKTKTTVSL